MPEETTTLAEWTLMGVAIISVLLPILAGKTGMPIFNLLGRWVRWFLFAAIFAFFLPLLELSFRPFWVHIITGLGFWFILETGYNWIAIKALSQSEIPLFPSFKVNTDGDDWPAEERFIQIREWLREQKYSRLVGLKSELFDETYLRASVYESADRNTRIQVLFIPKRKGGATSCFIITTNGADGRRIITDNLFLPYGGYYPEGWEITRKPIIGSLKRLLSLHHKRVLNSSMTPDLFEEDALGDINAQQTILERFNTETGFLVPRPRQELEGKITSEGRYRLWKEMWLLAYFGRSI